MLPILHGDRFIGRIDPKMDREQGRLMVNAGYAEAAAPMNRKTARSIRSAIEELAQFLDAKEVVFGKLVPEGWKRDLR